MDPARHDLAVAFVVFLDSEHSGVMMEIPESCVPIAKRCGWHVLAKDSDFPQSEIDPAQSNPRRDDTEE